jgi:hypothetical protein
MRGSDHRYLSGTDDGESGTNPSVTDGFCTDGVFELPIPSVTHDGWGVSLNPSVSVIRRRIGLDMGELFIFVPKTKKFPGVNWR